MHNSPEGRADQPAEAVDFELDEVDPEELDEALDALEPADFESPDELPPVLVVGLDELDESDFALPESDDEAEASTFGAAVSPAPVFPFALRASLR